MTDNTHPVTNFLLVTNIAIFFLGAAFHVQQALVQAYGFSMVQVVAQQWHVFITSGFLHSDIAHLLYNMFFLWVFGRTCEDELGSARTAVMYLAAMVTGSLFFGLLFPDQTAIGASGAVSGLVAAAILTAPGRDIYPTAGSLPIVVLAVLFLIPATLNAFNLTGGTANIAHVGGAFAGAALTLFWDRETAVRNMRELWLLWIGIALVVAAVLISAVY